MKPEDIESLRKLTPEELRKHISTYPQSEQVSRLIQLFESLSREQEELKAEKEKLEADIKKLRRNQGVDLIKGKRQKPLNYIPGKDKI